MSDEYADHFVDLGQHEYEMKLIMNTFDEPHRTKLLSALDLLSEVIQEVNKATDPTSISQEETVESLD